MFCKYIELSSKTIFNINLRKILSQYGKVSVMDYIIIRYPNGDLIFLILGTQGGEN